MRWTSVATVVLTAGLATAADDKPKNELEPFQGTWAVKAITRNGEAVPDEAAQKLSLVITGGERVVKEGDEVKSKATFTVDATKTPPHMDVTVTDGPLAGKTYPGVYELKGDTFTLCLALEGDTRPDDLTSKEGSNRLLQVFTKAKAEAEAVKESELRTELLARRKADTTARRKVLELLQKSNGKPEGEAAERLQQLVAEIQEMDAKHGEWLKGAVKTHGWPGVSLVGKDGAEAAFALAQHGGQSDLEFQKKCLELLAAAVKAKDASPVHLAHLTDRVRVAAGEKQVYGTEVVEKDGTLEAAPVEDEAKVDERRKEVGLPPLADSLKQMRKDRGYPEKK
jgi:uncharacterized protein (TIGR03067 family)